MAKIDENDLIKDVLNEVENEDNVDQTEADHQQNSEEENTISSLNQRIVTLEENYIRALAEADNMRKRYEKMLAESREYAISSFSTDLLTVLDNLNLALTYTNDLDNLIAGLKLTQQELKNIFIKQNISEVIPQSGDKFDYNLHNAISQVVTKDQEPDTIVQVMQAGYKFRDRLLRPAIVSVAKN